jgi:hypothetical protein
LRHTQDFSFGHWAMICVNRDLLMDDVVNIILQNSWWNQQIDLRAPRRCWDTEAEAL